MLALKIFRGFSSSSTIGLSRMAQSYQDAVHMLNMLQSNAAVLETIRVTRDAQRHLSLPQTIAMAQRTGLSLADIDTLSIIHVSGTKGKGSTCAFAESILRTHGFKTGFFSSPHLVEVRERFRINGRPLSREAFSQYFWHCYRQLDDTKAAHDGAMPAYFRFLTIMAFHVFLQERVDVAILEVGIGGQFDCTNIVRHPVVCGVTSLGIDHTSYLGDTVEKIAWHKAGIFKRGVPAVTVPQCDGAMQVLRQRAQEIECPLLVAPLVDISTSDTRQISLGIPGQYQILNASLAVQLCHIWLQNHAKSIDEREEMINSRRIMDDDRQVEITANIAAGLRLCNWPGRSQKVFGPGVTYYLDGAHTDESIQMCADWFNRESAIEAATVSGNVARVLLFNSTGDRKSDVLLSGLLSCKFDCAIFCPNIQRLSSQHSEDSVDMKVTLDAQLRRCTDNRNVWLDLLATQHRDQQQCDAVSASNSDVTPPTNALCLGTTAVGHHDDVDPMPTLTFRSIADSLLWVSRGRDDRLLTSGSGNNERVENGRMVHSKTTVVGLPEYLQRAEKVLLLCTGSLHLVGDILALLEPNICDR